MLPYPNIDPVALALGPLKIHWYGLMYLIGIGGAWWLAGRRLDRLDPTWSKEKLSDLVFWVALGVIAGGRLGYVLFYDLPAYLDNPSLALQIWRGGMSFHGGLLGVVVAFVYFCRRHQIPVGRVCDSLALAVCPGIFAVRVANFINGELYGRIIRPGDWEPPWAMRFPTDGAVQHMFDFTPGMGKRGQELEVLKAMSDGRWAQKISAYAPLRHPSQVYEALAEGLVLGLILWLTYRRSQSSDKPMGIGGYGGIFLIGYGVMRFGIEFFREPDDHFEKDSEGLGTILWGLSMGQLLCAAMILVGSYLLWRARPSSRPEASVA